MSRKTIFVDLDGTLVEHNSNPLKPLPGAIDKMEKWFYEDDCVVIITTARPDECIDDLSDQLYRLEVPHHWLLTGLGDGVRYLINDGKPGVMDDTAVGITVERNVGIKDTEL